MKLRWRNVPVAAESRERDASYLPEILVSRSLTTGVEQGVTELFVEGLEDNCHTGERVHRAHRTSFGRREEAPSRFSLGNRGQSSTPQLVDWKTLRRTRLATGAPETSPELHHQIGCFVGNVQRSAPQCPMSCPYELHCTTVGQAAGVGDGKMREERSENPDPFTGSRLTISKQTS